MASASVSCFHQVRPIRCQSVEDSSTTERIRAPIGDIQYRFQPLGIPAAIPVLMVIANDWFNWIREID